MRYWVVRATRIGPMATTTITRAVFASDLEEAVHEFRNLFQDHFSLPWILEATEVNAESVAISL